MSSQQGDSISPLKRAYLAIEELESRLARIELASHAPIAIVGVGMRFPGGVNDPDSFWRLLMDGTDAIREVPADRWNIDDYFDPNPDAAGKIASRFGGFVNDVDQFDPLLFGISPREAERMDPQQRLLLETAWEALERAGIAPDRLNGSSTGVFVGMTTNDYSAVQQAAQGVEGFGKYYASGYAHSIAAGRLSYLLGLQGPAIAIDTACSSSLVATHLAVQSLRSGESSRAIVGGVNLMLSAELSIALSRLHMLAPDGRCKAFDASADGFVRGEGCGVVVLERLDDAVARRAPILAVIRGSAVNQDGRSSGLTAPSGPAQTAVIQAALADAGLTPADIDYVEAHGTGTALGDPIEAQAMAAALGDRGEAGPLLVGSVKTNLGHLEAAAGVAGLIKVALLLNRGQIPPSLHLTTPNPHIPWERLPLAIPTIPQAWPVRERPRRAGVSGFGFSGTNAHLLLEAPPSGIPADQETPTEGDQRPLELLTLSAQTPAALAALAGRYAHHLARDPGLALADVAASAHRSRAMLPERLALVATDATVAAEQLAAVAAGATGSVRVGRARATPPAVAFLFTGQGAQYAGMGQVLDRSEPVFRAALDRCAQVLDPLLGRSLRSILFAAADDPEAGLLDQTRYTQPALVALEVALAELWRAWGVEPVAVAGHSLGEYAAAIVAGVLSLEDGLRLVAARGRLMGSLPTGGAMAAIFAPVANVEKAIADFGNSISIAAINGPAHTVISGNGNAVNAVTELMAKDGIRVRQLTVSHAFHSSLMEPVLDDFKQELEQVTWRQPRIRLFANLTGAAATGEMATPAYWIRQTREPVQFETCVRSMLDRDYNVFLEIGPHPVLSGMAQECAGSAEAIWLPSLRRGRDDWATILDSLGQIFVEGITPNWDAVAGQQPRKHVDLPTYPFQHQRYWVETKRRSTRPAQPSAGEMHPLLGERVRSALKDTMHESIIDAEGLSYLNDHRVFGRAILPGAAFVELALAAALDTSSHVDDLIIHSPLVVNDDDARVIQTISSPDDSQRTVQVFSRDIAADDWTLHATARLESASVVQASAAIDLDEIRARCAESIEAGTHYGTLQERGIELGPSLQGVINLWKGESEALAEIILPESEVADAHLYRIHPALLDAAFQTLTAVVPDTDETYLPIALERASVLAGCDTTVWCHARLRPVINANGHGPRETLTADLTIYRADGRPCVALSGLTLKRASQIAIEPLDRLLYEVVWKPVAVPAATAEPDALADAALRLLDREPNRMDDLAQYQRMNGHLDSLSLDYVVCALGQLGWRPTPGELVDSNRLAQSLNVAERHHRLMGRLVDILAEDGLLEPDGDGYVVARNVDPIDPESLEHRRLNLLEIAPEFEAELTLLGRCGHSLSDALRGDADPLQLLFPNGDTRAAEQLYTASPVAGVYNAMVREAVAEAIAHRGDQPVRILEVGGGTGGTTAHLLPILPSDRTNYVFTDISPAFTAKAAQKFSQYPFIDCRPLDIERDPQPQGFDGDGYDIILAVNVLHAVSDLRQALDNVRKLLVPGGLLLLIEVTAPQRWIDLTFGLTDGWWLFTDFDLRQDYPLLSRPQWCELLASVGYDVAAVQPGDPPLVEETLVIARAGQTDSMSFDGDWLILADDHGVGDELATLITERGARPLLVRHSAMPTNGDFHVDPADPNGLRRLLDGSVIDPARLEGVIYLWALDTDMEASFGELHLSQSLAIGGALHTVQALLGSGANPRLWFVTRGAQPAGTTDVSAPMQAAIGGLRKTIALEHPELRATIVDLDPAVDQPAQFLMREIAAADHEDQISLRGSERFVARLNHMHTRPIDVIDGSDAIELAIVDQGKLDGLGLRPATRRRPAAGEVEIRVDATGLNFKDVMNLLGMYPGDPGPLGGESTGTVVAVGPGVEHVRPGDDVIALAGGSFQRYVTTRADFVVPRPGRLSIAQAATNAIAYVTASVALNHLGRMQAGERVLIHAAAGGVGLAAVHLARAAGAEVFATAGSPAKREYLHELGVRHVFDSRSLDFADDILATTNGEGVDLVLNSLAGAFIPASLGLLRHGGRFLELGKRDHVSPDEIAALDKDITYHVIDWGETAQEDPPLISGILHDVLGRVADGTLAALPVRSFPLQEAEDAFRYMARARHIGKVAVTWPLADADVIRSDGFYLITGGLRGLGREVASHLVSRGARHLLLMGRGAPTTATQAVIDELTSQGAQILVHRGDASQELDIVSALAAIDREGLPLRGVFHCAGVLDDGSLTQQDWERFRHVLAPKIDGAWLLHHLTLDRPIEHFVLFSSVAAVLGSPGQANHAAANAYLDALARHRRGIGLPALSINWGAWSDIGAAAGQAVSERARQSGIDAITPERGLQALAWLLGRGPAQAAVAQVRWPVFVERFSSIPPFFHDVVASSSAPEKPAAHTSTSMPDIQAMLATATPGRRFDIVLDVVQDAAGVVLGLAPSQIGTRTPLNDFGLDSLMAVELRNRLGQRFGFAHPLPATLVFDYPNVEAIANYLIESVFELDDDDTAEEQPAPASASGDLVAAMLDGLDALSDDDVDNLLAERASQRGNR